MPQKRALRGQELVWYVWTMLDPWEDNIIVIAVRASESSLAPTYGVQEAVSLFQAEKINAMMLPKLIERITGSEALVLPDFDNSARISQAQTSEDDIL